MPKEKTFSFLVTHARGWGAEQATRSGEPVYIRGANRRKTQNGEL
jgi:hypothetical protein